MLLKGKHAEEEEPVAEDEEFVEEDVAAGAEEEEVFTPRVAEVSGDQVPSPDRKRSRLDDPEWDAFEDLDDEY